MKRVCALALALALATGFGPAAGAQDTATARVPLQRLSLGEIGGWIEVVVEANGQPGRWLVDTGSTRNLVSPAFAERHALVPRAAVRADTAVGPVQGTEVALPALKLGAVERREQTALRMDDLRQLVGPAAEGLEGILGAPFLNDLALDLDLRDWTMGLAASGPAACPAGTEALPLSLHRGLPVIEVRINGQPAESLLLDTGNPAAVVRIAATGPDATAPGLALPGGARLAVAHTVAVGTLQRTQVPVVSLPAPTLRRALDARIAGLAGTALLDGTRWLIDLGQRRACVESRSQPVPGGFGLTLVQREGGLQIDSVLPGGPAEAAGLRAGEPVTHWVDGPPTGPLRALWARVQGRETIDLRVGADARAVQLRRAWFAPALP